jgi:hypothetical protein
VRHRAARPIVNCLRPQELSSRAPLSFDDEKSLRVRGPIARDFSESSEQCTSRAEPPQAVPPLGRRPPSAWPSDPRFAGHAPHPGPAEHASLEAPSLKS